LYLQTRTGAKEGVPRWPMPVANRESSVHLAWVLISVLLALALRVIGLNRQLWYDEIVTLIIRRTRAKAGGKPEWGVLSDGLTRRSRGHIFEPAYG